MTVSVFDAYLERAVLHRTERVMDAAQASFYSQVTTDSRSKMWAGWQNVITHINSTMIYRNAISAGQNPLVWNGKKMSIKGLIAKFAQTWGKKAVT